MRTPEPITRLSNVNGRLPFTHYVWFMENGDDSWRICAATMDEGDARAIVLASDPMGGALLALPCDERPPEPWYYG